MVVPSSKSVLTSPRFWKFLLTISIVLVLFYVMTDDLQEYHTLYMYKVTRPTSRHFVCINIRGKQLERKLFEFAFSVGIAHSIGSSLIMRKDETIRRVFDLKPVKFLKKLNVCDTFQKISYPSCGENNPNVTSIDIQQDRHYKVNSCDSSKMPSILYFDENKHILMDYLKFTHEIDIQAQQFFRTLIHVEDDGLDKRRTHIAIYLANSTSLADDYITKYLTVAVNYFLTRSPGAKFVVYSSNLNLARSILKEQNINSVYIDDKFIMATKPEVLMRVLSLCDHVITSGAADMFGWWVGYFSKGTVVYPRKYSEHSDNSGQSNKDIYPHSWIGLVF